MGPFVAAWFVDLHISLEIEREGSNSVCDCEVEMHPTLLEALHMNGSNFTTSVGLGRMQGAQRPHYLTSISLRLLLTAVRLEWR